MSYLPAWWSKEGFGCSESEDKLQPARARSSAERQREGGYCQVHGVTTDTEQRGGGP